MQGYEFCKILLSYANVDKIMQNDEVVDAPVSIIDHEILDMADLAIEGVNSVSGH
jgi:hypothetical protein